MSWLCTLGLMNLKLMVGGTFLAATALAAAGCSSSSSTPPASTGSAPSGTASASAAAAVVPLVVYSAQGYDSAETKAFTAATGIPVKLDDNSTGPLDRKSVV